MADLHLDESFWKVCVLSPHLRIALLPFLSSCLTHPVDGFQMFNATGNFPG